MTIICLTIDLGGGTVEKIKQVRTDEEAVKFMGIALEHEWAVSFEYLIHAYSMPKAKFFYQDPVLKSRADVRGQTIQIGIDEMYHALQLGIVIRQMGGEPSFRTDDVVRYPRIIENLKRDKMTEDQVTDLYQSAKVENPAYAKLENMALNISCDEVRHSRQFAVMIETLKNSGAEEALCFKTTPEAERKPEVRMIHDIMRSENELMHAYLKSVILFSEHQDLFQRLFKNSIDHMRHWDKNSGLLIKLGSVLKIENGEIDPAGVERSTSPMPRVRGGEDRISALESLLPAEEMLIGKYEALLAAIPDGEIKDQLGSQLALKREHLFTQEWLLKNARKIKGL